LVINQYQLFLLIFYANFSLEPLIKLATVIIPKTQSFAIGIAEGPNFVDTLLNGQTKILKFPDQEKFSHLLTRDLHALFLRVVLSMLQNNATQSRR